jgi:hypothetical protein
LTPKLYEYFQEIGNAIPKYTNPADHLIKLIHAKEKPDQKDIELQNKFFQNYDTILKPKIAKEMTEIKSKVNELDKKRLQGFRVSSFGLQFQQLMIRAFRNTCRNPTFTRVRTIQTIILGILNLILFWNKSTYGMQDVKDKNGCLFFVCTSQFMLAIQSVLLTCNLITNKYI